MAIVSENNRWTVKWSKTAHNDLFGLQMAWKNWKPLYFDIFGVEKTDFGNIKLIFGANVWFFGDTLWQN